MRYYLTMITFTPEQVAKANRTARGAGAVGMMAVVPKYIGYTALWTESILDFGSGPRAIHTRRMREMGYNVEAYDFGANYRKDEVFGDLSKHYDIVFASNVLNVQSDEEMMRKTLRLMLVPNPKRIVFNYPKDPRHSTLSADDVRRIVRELYGVEPKWVGGAWGAPLMEVTF